jgi:hypothetical protein
MKAARQYAADERSAEVAHVPSSRRRAPWWLVATMAPTIVVVGLCIGDATAWVGRPFAGFLFLDSRIVVSIAAPPGACRRSAAPSGRT